jgi:hypothetical protein
LNNGIYLAKAGRNQEALVSLKAAHEKAGDAKTQLQVAEYAKKAGDTALYTAAVKKACSLGMQAACGLVNG